MNESKQYFIALMKAKKMEMSDLSIQINWGAIENYPKGPLLEAMKEALITKFDFFEVADLIEIIKKRNGSNQKQLAEKAWEEVLSSARYGGSKVISAKSAKVLNGFGGMSRLRESSRDALNWFRKDFIDAYTNTPYPKDKGFRCEGLMAPMYLETEGEPESLELCTKKKGGG